MSASSFAHIRSLQPQWNSLKDQLRRHTVPMACMRHEEGMDRTAMEASRQRFCTDVKAALMEPGGARATADLLLAQIRTLTPQAHVVAGPALGGAPIVSCLLVVSDLATPSSGDVRPPMQGLLIRKEPKRQRAPHIWIEGRSNVAEGSMVVLVDDVISSGSALITAARRLREAALHPILALTVLDREEGGALRLREEAGIPLHTLFTSSEVAP